MTIETLLKQLDNLDAHSTAINQTTFSFAIAICFGIFMLIPIFASFITPFHFKKIYPAEEVAEKVKAERTQYKYLLIILTSIAIWFLSVGIYGQHKYHLVTLKDKQTHESFEITEWEQTNDVQTYLNSLPKQTKEVRGYKKLNKGLDQEVTVEINNHIEKIKLTNNTDVIIVRKSDQTHHKDLPQKDYIIYREVPQTLTKHYKKGTILVDKFIKVEEF